MLICSCLRVILKHLNLTGPRGGQIRPCSPLWLICTPNIGFPYSSPQAIPFDTQKLLHYVPFWYGHPLSFVPFTHSPHLTKV
jgi:hypothetical protein